MQLWSFIVILMHIILLDELNELTFDQIGCSGRGGTR